jgi:cyclopropane fatty-acyl-phospholipid synthase-like methyltransferase
LRKQFDWVLSLEVGEHLPKEFERIFIENLHRHNVKGIVLSWALKGQGGEGHFNEQNNGYIKELMAQYGYVNDIAAENALRNEAMLWWFRNTVMVFRRK